MGAILVLSIEIIQFWFVYQEDAEKILAWMFFLSVVSKTKTPADWSAKDTLNFV